MNKFWLKHGPDPCIRIKVSRAARDATIYLSHQGMARKPRDESGRSFPVCIVFKPPCAILRRARDGVSILPERALCGLISHAITRNPRDHPVYIYKDGAGCIFCIGTHTHARVRTLVPPGGISTCQARDGTYHTPRDGTDTLPRDWISRSPRDQILKMPRDWIRRSPRDIPVATGESAYSSNCRLHTRLTRTAKLRGKARYRWRTAMLVNRSARPVMEENTLK